MPNVYCSIKLHFIKDYIVLWQLLHCGYLNHCYIRQGTKQTILLPGFSVNSIIYCLLKSRYQEKWHYFERVWRGFIQKQGGHTWVMRDFWMVPECGNLQDVSRVFGKEKDRNSVHVNSILAWGMFGCVIIRWSKGGLIWKKLCTCIEFFFLWQKFTRILHVQQSNPLG